MQFLWFWPSALPRYWEELDEACGEFVEALWAEGGQLATAQNCLSGIKHFFPAAHNRLRFSRSLCKAWQRAEPPTRAAPMPPLVVLGLAGFCASVGAIGVAILLLVGFDAFLRSGELFGILKKDIMLFKGHAMIRLPSTKSGSRQGHTEMVIVRSRVAVTWLTALASRLKPGQPLTRRNPFQLRALLKDLLRGFGLEDRGFNWYSLRRGGASWDFMSHGLMEKTLLRGRWQSNKAARVYVQDAAAALADLRLSSEQKEVLRAAARHLD